MAKQVAVTRVHEEGMTGQATPAGQVSPHAWITCSNLQRLMRSQVTYAVCDGMQDTRGVSIISIIESIGLPDGGSAFAHYVPFPFFAPLEAVREPFRTICSMKE